MSRLPRFISEALAKVSARDGNAGRVAAGLADLLTAETRCGDLSRAVEAFREAARSVGILEEARNGQHVYDAWCKLVHFFLEPLAGLKAGLCGDPAETDETPRGHEAFGALWEKVAPELTALMEEHSAIHRMLQESPVGTHVGFRVRSRLLLLDRRAERVKVALDLVRRELSKAAREAAEVLRDGPRKKGSGRREGGEESAGGSS